MILIWDLGPGFKPGTVHLLFLMAVLLGAYLAPRMHCLQQWVVTRCLQELLVQAFLGPLQYLLQQFLQHDMSCLHGGVGNDPYSLRYALPAASMGMSARIPVACE